MIDQSIKRAVILAVIVVVVAKLASAMLDGLMWTSEEEAAANRQAFQEHHQVLASSQNEAIVRERIAEHCLKTMSQPACTHPKKYREVRTCISSLKFARCGELPRVNLCAAVEELERCADPFADPKRSGCRDLRRVADCRNHPAPEDRSGLWMIEMDDGFWHGDD